MAFNIQVIRNDISPQGYSDRDYRLTPLGNTNDIQTNMEFEYLKYKSHHQKFLAKHNSLKAEFARAVIEALADPNNLHYFHQRKIFNLINYEIIADGYDQIQQNLFNKMNNLIALQPFDILNVKNTY